MLDAGRPPQRIGALTLFHDHADAHRRYVLADAPGLVLDAHQNPQLSLLLFRGGSGAAAAGGLLQFEAALAPSAAQLAAAEKELIAKGIETPNLVRPDWRAGSVRLAGWLEADELKPLALYSGAPSLVGDPLALVSARLDAAGAALADAALRGNALPTVLIFELETLGLAGPLGIEAEAELQALHDRLSAEGALTTPYGRARIAKTWEQAARDNLIRVRVVDESGDVESRRAEAMRRIGEDLIARLFSPYPPAEKPPQLGDETLAPIELSFRLTMRREELATSTRWDFRERRAVVIRHHAAASLIGLLGARPASDHIRTAELDHPSAELTLRAEPELARLGIAALEVDVREAGGDALLQTLTLTDAAPELRIAIAAECGPLQWRARARFDPLVTQVADRTSHWHDANGYLIAVSARRLFPPRVLTVIAGRVEFDWLDHVEVVVEAAPDAPRSLRLDASTPSAEAFFASAADAPLRVSAHWRGRGDEPAASDTPRDVSDDVLVLDSPFADSIDVLLVPLPLAGVRTLSVELRWNVGALDQHKTVAWELPAREPQRMALRRLRGSPASYAYRVQRVGDDGTLDEGPWIETERTTLVIGADAAAAVRQVKVLLLGGVSGRGAFAIELIYACGDARSSELLEGEHDSATLTLVVPRDAPPAELLVREYLDSGAVRETRWPDPPSLLVVPPASTIPAQ